jgi:hypothetical protein
MFIAIQVSFLNSCAKGITSFLFNFESKCKISMKSKKTDNVVYSDDEV